MTNLNDENQDAALEDLVQAVIAGRPFSKEELEQMVADELSSKAVSEGFEKMLAGRPMSGGGWVILTSILAYLDAFLRENGYGSCGPIYTYDYDIEAQVKALADKDITDGIVAPVKVEPQYSNSFAEEMTRLWAWLVRSKVWRDYDEENLRILEDRAVDNRISMPFARDKLMGARTSTDRLTESFPQPGQLPQDHIPLEMQITRDKNLEIYGTANSHEKVAEKPRRVRQTRGGSKGPDITKFRSDPGQDGVPGPTSPPIFAPTPTPAYTPPASSEFTPPAQRSQHPPPKDRFSGPFTGLSPAAAAALAAPAYTPPAAGAAASGAPQVIINGILPPPTRLADEDFKRCLQREIDQIVWTFDTGMRG